MNQGLRLFLVRSDAGVEDSPAAGLLEEIYLIHCVGASSECVAGLI